MMASGSGVLSRMRGMLGVAFLAWSCRERPEVRADLPLRVDAPAARDAAPDEAPNRAVASAEVASGDELDCYAWISDPRPPEKKPFPYEVHPGKAIGIAMKWADRTYPTVSVGIGHENVRCPPAACTAACWFEIRLEDTKATTTSHLLEWIAVDARTGKVARRDYADGGGWAHVP